MQFMQFRKFWDAKNLKEEMSESYSLQVNLSHSPQIYGNTARKQEKVPLYCINHPSSRFIVILEGRATVKFQNVSEICFSNFNSNISLP